MSILEAFILGIVQGLTEFLPVSSSGHLELVKALLGNDSLPAESLLLTVVLHFATALATMVVFRKDIAQIFKGLFQFKANEEFTFSLKIVLSMIPAAVIGVLFNDEIEALFSQQILLVGFMLLLTGGLLFLADRAKKTDRNVGYTHALIIGIAQAIAILPGISRSGATISTAVLLGIDREKSARFSFLMVIPLILGKMAKDIMEGQLMETQIGWAPLIVGATAAFIAGLFACQWMIALVKKSQLKYFSFYCLIVGVLAIVFS
ncbi:MAG: undecaprenyl-diphosphate phosphatase [Flavobacteriales bacterium]|nr:undecaprenyl-diphosphate phosphatase [Flavobacteriales bacterium]NCG30775.1 UDP-diphosphatase [Bacteroidota bacterium]MBT3964289.1 undecaprenyl-diphosphate phosphatase [Flavobacteriales bacterium]MBT4705577.1 undecaprenyl-diphosphate phosphatase [Flavobacteriales bacterium]MBT4931116.1 undecaprenyl-diphosphate phosphatase [Flavobacteriales bacterium]